MLCCWIPQYNIFLHGFVMFPFYFIVSAYTILMFHHVLSRKYLLGSFFTFSTKLDLYLKDTCISLAFLSLTS